MMLLDLYQNHGQTRLWQILFFTLWRMTHRFRRCHFTWQALLQNGSVTWRPSTKENNKSNHQLLWEERCKDYNRSYPSKCTNNRWSVKACHHHEIKWQQPDRVLPSQCRTFLVLDWKMSLLKLRFYWQH